MSDDRVGYGELFSLWLPLALSWVMMSVAGPIVSAGISRLPDAAINLAAHGLTMDIAVLVESPIIMILSISVALVRSRTSYLLLRRFVTHLSITLTIIGLLVYFTPAYDIIFLQLIGVPVAVAEAARPALRVMLLWPAAIGWRRLFQGILIVHGRSKQVSYGTVFRLVALTLTVMIGAGMGLRPGALVGGLAMAISVIVEMLAVMWWTLPLIRTKVAPVLVDPANCPPMDYRRLLYFYLPLAGTDMMRVLSRPVTSAGIARAANSALSLAAWPIASGLSGLLSSSVMALQEVVLARIDRAGSQRKLALFSAAVGLALTGLLGLLIVTPLARWYFGVLLGVPADVAAYAVPAVLILVPTPLLLAGRNLFRGLFISRRRSGLVQLGMFVNLFSLAAFLWLGLRMDNLQGVMLAAWATVGAEVLEVALLQWLMRERRARSALATVAE
ncbi:MAG: hypothetical protein FJ026_00405 [Chloroflexi bacterium]|nr:hypothetical protein [Chloroflexota bacterium]